MEWLTSRFELSRGGVRDNLRPMEGLRGFAVFMVFWVHYATLCEPWYPTQTITATIADYMHSIGNSGVDLFFVLSGYLIYGSLISRQQNFFRYIRKNRTDLFGIHGGIGNLSGFIIHQPTR